MAESLLNCHWARGNRRKEDGKTFSNEAPGRNLDTRSCNLESGGCSLHLNGLNSERPQDMATAGLYQWIALSTTGKGRSLPTFRKESIHSLVSSTRLRRTRWNQSDNNYTISHSISSPPKNAWPRQQPCYGRTG